MTLRELWMMREGAMEFWATVMYGGPSGSSGGDQRIDYDPNWLMAKIESGQVEGMESDGRPI